MVAAPAASNTLLLTGVLGLYVDITSICFVKMNLQLAASTLTSYLLAICSAGASTSVSCEAARPFTLHAGACKALNYMQKPTKALKLMGCLKSALNLDHVVFQV